MIITVSLVILFLIIIILISQLKPRPMWQVRYYINSENKMIVQHRERKDFSSLLSLYNIEIK